MSIITVASGNSVWRGYDYYRDKKVKVSSKLNENEYKGFVHGSEKNKYAVKIDVKHPRKSTCTCPHASGKTIICKHMVALFLTVFPEEADQLLQEWNHNGSPAEKRERERQMKIRKYVDSLPISELREIVYEMLINEENNRNRW